jgi:hypothetical protein
MCRDAKCVRIAMSVRRIGCIGGISKGQEYVFVVQASCDLGVLISLHKRGRIIFTPPVVR